MTKTEMAAAEMIEALQTGDMDVTWQRYADSRSVLYAAAGVALEWARAQLEERGLALDASTHQRAAHEKEITRSSAERDRASAELEHVSGELNKARRELASRNALLEQLHRLEAWGFDVERLGELHSFTSRIAADQGTVPEDGAAEVFAFLSRYEGIASLDLEARRAERRVQEARAEAERWIAEAKSRQAQTKVRVTVIDTLERLLTEGVNEADIARWDRILRKVGSSPAELTRGLAQWGSVEKLAEESQRRLATIESAEVDASARLAILRKFELQITEAIRAVQDEGVDKVASTAASVLVSIQRLESAALDYGRLEQGAAMFWRELAVARAILASTPENLRKISRATVQLWLSTMIKWVQAVDYNPAVAMPPVVQSAWLSSVFTSTLSVEHLLMWAFHGLFTGDERRSLPGGAG